MNIVKIHEHACEIIRELMPTLKDINPLLHTDLEERLMTETISPTDALYTILSATEEAVFKAEYEYFEEEVK